MNVVRNYLLDLTSNENMYSTAVEIAKDSSKHDFFEFSPLPTFKKRRVKRLKSAKKLQTSRWMASELL